MQAASISPSVTPPVGSPVTVPKIVSTSRSPQAGFSGVLESVRTQSSPEIVSLDRLQNRILGGESVQPRELLIYQMQVYRLGMRVELYSKLAEGLSASVRKLQNQ